MIMRKKSGFTIVEQAAVLVPEFEDVVCKLEQQVVLRGQSKSTLKNYIRRIALFVVHFGKLPEQIEPDEINAIFKERHQTTCHTQPKGTERTFCSTNVAKTTRRADFDLFSRTQGTGSHQPENIRHRFRA